MKYLLILIFSLNLFAIEIEEIIKKADTILRGKTNYSKFKMVIETKRWKRSMELESFSEGDDKSFIKILYPKKDRGITFLKLNDEMWQYIPKIEKIIKIPPSMMLQSWMGSDFSNDDLMKESSIVNDYHKKLLSEDSKVWQIELKPKEDVAIVWDRLIVTIDKSNYLFKEINFYDEEGTLIRTLYYEDVKFMDDRNIPTKWVMTPKTKDKLGNSTTIILLDTIFDKPIDTIYFTKQALKKFSKR